MTVAADTGKSVPQIALNWLLQRPTVVHDPHWCTGRDSSCVKISARSAGSCRKSKWRGVDAGQRSHAAVSLSTRIGTDRCAERTAPPVPGTR